MITRLTKTHVDHVLKGCDVRGEYRTPPLRFPKNARKRRHLEMWTHATLNTTGPRLTIAQRTQLIRKLAIFMIRSTNTNASLMAKGLRYLRQRPHLLDTRISFATAILRALQDERRILNQNDGTRIRVVLAHAARPCPPRPVLATEGPFSLEELVHPRHLMETGLAANNCLLVRVQGVAIANRHYWGDINAGKSRLFAIYSAGDLRMVFQVEEGRIIAREKVSRGQDLDKAFPALIRALSSAIGPIDASIWRYNDPLRAQALNTAADDDEMALAILGAIPGARPFKRLPFPSAYETRQLLAEVVTHFMRMRPAHTEEQRLRLARKAAVYLIRHPVKDNTFRLIRGSTWFATRPETLSTNLSFAGAARLQDIGWRTFENTQRRALVRRLKLDMDLPYAPPPVLLEQGAFRLTRLIHARHQVEVGRAGAPALILKYKGRSYPNSRFWSQVRAGHRSHFALWEGDSLCTTFSLIGRTLNDQTLFKPRGSLVGIMTEVVSAIEAITGPVLKMDPTYLWPKRAIAREGDGAP